jgi:hypothetical protein
MSTSLLRGCAILLALGAVTPALTRGQLPLLPHASCCQACFQPRPRCHCITFRPVVETRLRPQSVVTWRNVHGTAYRCQPRVETVPVVTYRSRIRYEMVPYTVTRRVPQYSTRMVPERRIRYVPIHLGTSPVSQWGTSQGRWQRFNNSVSPAAAQQFRSTPVAGAYGDWTTVPSRRKPISPTPSFLTGDARITGIETQHIDTDHKHKTVDTPFVRAPSAALVWQTPGPR